MKHFFPITVLALSLFVVSCKPEIDFVSYKAPMAEISQSGGDLSIDFSSDAGSATIQLEASKTWTASFVNDRAKDWCKLSLESGKRGTANITVSVSQNPDYDQRSASIIFQCDDVKRTIVVTQKQKEAILVSSSRLDVGVGGGQIMVEVKASTPYEYSIAESAKSWITPVRTKGMSETKLYFNVSENDSVDKRVGNIVFTGSTVREVVNVYQDGETPTLVVSSSLEEIPAEENEFVVEVRSNLDITMTIPDNCDWLKEVRTKTVSTNSFYFKAERNHSRKSRSASIEFRDKKRGASETVQVIQSLQPIIIPCDTLRAQARGWTASFQTADPDLSAYRLEFPDNWLNLAQEEENQENQFSVTVSPLIDAIESRLGMVRVFYKDFAEPDTVWIRQYRQLPSFSFTSSAQRVSVPQLEEDGQVGFVFWGDGSQETWRPGLEHNYKSSGMHTITIEILNKKKVPVTGIENGMTINLKELRK